MQKTIYLTIVIPIRNEEANIGSVLEMLAGQEYPNERYELIIVDGQSTDGTRSTVERFIRENPDVNTRLLENPGQWSSRARNIGIRAAQGQLIAIIDGHVYVPSEKLFASMERLKIDRNALCLARPAPLLVANDGAGVASWIAVARKCWLAHSRNSYIYSDFEGFVDPVSSGFAYDQSVFERVGYFDETFDAAEDVEFHHRLKLAGIRAYTSPELTINSYARANLRSLFFQMTRYGIGRAHFIRKHAGTFTVETLVPPSVFLFSVGLPIVALLAYWFPWVGIAYASGLAVYVLTVCVTGIVAALRKGRVLPGFTVAFAVWITHIGLGWGFLKAVFLSSRRLFPERYENDEMTSAIELKGKLSV